MRNWQRLPQDEGHGEKYYFTGKVYLSQGVNSELSPAEILFIYWDLRAFAEVMNGIDYLQIYVNEHGSKLYVIDNISPSMIVTGEYNPEDNYCTLLWAYEY